MNYHLYYHNDFDGTASGAIILNFLYSRGDSIASFNPIDYTPKLIASWVGYKFKKPFILVDFRYHPKADWWFDHHEVSFPRLVKTEWKKHFRNDQTHCWDRKRKSCCGLILAHLKKHFGFKLPKHIAELAKWADIIDAAGYKSAREAISYSKPAFQLMAIVTDENNSKNTHDLIKKLAEKSMAKIVKEPRIKTRVSDFILKLKKLIKDLKTISKPYGSTIFFDVSDISPDVSHYMSYFLYPSVKYSVILKRGKGNDYYHLGVGKNPWIGQSEKTNIGELMSKYKGGGHKNVGATQSNSKKEIMKITGEIIEYLNKNG
ncbi:MAG: hypothetical protein HYX20_03640 [Candidatus Yanofskybacteria bacterium]|nr:hypothetical protein [Candidatus Yanofskybacteria bacterium]